MKKLSLVEVIAMAVGTMIGASIFSIFGLGAQVAGRNLPEAFLLSGIYAFVVAYSYGILGNQIISNAGPIGFILKGLGDGLVSGTLSILLWMSYVVSIALLVKGFAGYFVPLVHLPTTFLSNAIVESILLFLFVGLHFLGNKAVGKAELYIVGIKLTILMVFIVGGVWTLQWQNIKPDLDGSHLGQLVNASVIFFLSYMGFGIITNASENIKNPKQNVRRAIYASITVVILIYVLIAVVTLGNLPLSTIISAKENALAIAAKPFLGPAGFFLISIGALFSISSALNASIFGGANIAYSLAKDGELPTFFERKVWFKSTEGLYITAGLGLTFALIFNLGAIATITSSVLTVVYLFVVVAHLRMCDQYGGNRTVLRFNFLLLVAVFVALMLYQWQSHRGAFYGSIVTFAGAFSLELFLRKVMKRNFTEHHKDNFKTRHEQVVHEQSSGTEDRH